MNYFYSPHTGEHIATDTPADWMGATALPVPPYDKSTDSCLFESGAWVIRRTRFTSSSR